MSDKNIIEKIWETHVVKENPGHPVILAIDLLLLHEVTSAQAFETLEEKGLSVFDTSRCLATVDHSTPTRKNRFEIYDEAGRIQVERMRQNAKKHGIPFYDFDSGRQGIVHVIGPEQGATQPGMTIVCGDSHTATHGAFGALAFGVGTSEVGHVLATGCMLSRKPKTMRVEFRGRFRKGVFAKDAILKLISEIGIDGGTGHVIEYTGDMIHALSMEERMTICNMSIECGARAGLISPDETCLDYLRGRYFSPKGAEWEKAVSRWMSFASGADAAYDRTVAIDVSTLSPMVTWGTNPAQAVDVHGRVPHIADFSGAAQALTKRALDYVGLEEGREIGGVEIDWAFVGSCTNGRIEDLRVAAKVLKGRKVNKAVTFYIVPGSEAVMRQAQEEGLDKIFVEAGADFRMPGCSMCLAMNDDVVPAGKRCISSSNRNFVGRQGTGSMTHLASPATVAASAIEGKIVSPESYL